MNVFPRGLKTSYAIACLLLSLLAVEAFAEPVEQDTVEAAVTLQLLGFTEWPEDKTRDESAPRIIGVFDSEGAFEAFESLLADSRFKGRFEVTQINADTPDAQLFRCDVIFFSEADPTEIPRILKRIEARPVVLVGAFEGFLEQGGLVNLVKKQRRLGFEIHLDNSKRRGIEFRAKLLRLATRIVQE